VIAGSRSSGICTTTRPGCSPNSGLHDAHNLAWKLALELRGRARPALVASYAHERAAAAQHVLATSDRVHQMVQSAVKFARTGVASPPLSAAETATLTRARAMLDVSYAGSPITGEYRQPDGRDGGQPAPGGRYPGWPGLASPAHQLLLHGAAPGNLARFRDRWGDLVQVVRRPADAGESGTKGPGAVLIRPDGYVGFRATPADEAGLDALDAHLCSYLIPAADHDLLAGEGSTAGSERRFTS
jgi:hypothetical protein